MATSTPPGAPVPVWVAAWVVPVVVALALQGALYGGYYLDDTFIHLTYVRGLVERGTLDYNGVAVNGATAPGWVLLLSSILSAVSVEPLALARMLSLGLFLAAVILTGRTAASVCGRGDVGTVAAVVLALDLWGAKFASTGMETSAAVALVAGALALEAAGAGLVAPFLWSLLPLFRPEAGLMALPFALVSLREGRVRSLSAVVGRLVLLVLPTSLWGLWSYGCTGSFLPTTLAAKSSVLTVSSLGGSMVQLMMLAAPVVLVPLGWWVVALRRARWRPGDVADRVVVLSVAGLVLVLLFFLGTGALRTGRYLAILGPVTALAAGRAVSLLVPVGSRPGLVGATAVLVLPSLLAAFHLGVPWVGNYMDLLVEGEVAVGRLVAAEADPGAMIAAHDVGAVGYHSGLRVFDLVGLVTPRVIGADRAGLLRALGEARPSYLMDLVGPEARSPLVHDLPVTARVMVRRSFPGYSRRASAPFELVLWELTWNRRDEDL